MNERKDFIELFEKKLRKEVRESSIQRRDNICIIDTGDNNYLVLNDFLRNKIGLPLEFSESGKKVYPSSLEEKGRDLLKLFFEKRKDEEEPKREEDKKPKEIISLLTSFTQEEINREASYLGFEGKSRESDEIINMINRLDARFKNIKTSLGKSADVINSLK